MLVMVMKNEGDRQQCGRLNLRWRRQGRNPRDVDASGVAHFSN